MKECSVCKRKEQYLDIDGALDHLQQFHDGGQVDTLTGDRGLMRDCLVTVKTEGQEDRNERLLVFVQTLPWTHEEAPF